MRAPRAWMRICIAPIVGLGLLALGNTALADSPYRLVSGARSLTLDTTRIAILEGPGRPDAMAQALEGAGLPPRIEAHTLVGWWLAELPLEDRNAPTIERLTATLAADERVGFVSPVFVDDLGGPLVVTPTLLVRFIDGVPRAEEESLLRSVTPADAVDRDWGGMSGAYRLRASQRNGFAVLAQANQLAGRPEVKWAEPDMIFTGTSSYMPNDPGFPLVWGIDNTGQSGGTADMDMDGPEAWDITFGNANMFVVIIDTGVQQDHPDINQIAGRDFTGALGGGGPVNECDNHGTPVAGCVSAVIDNNLGTVGIAPGVSSASARTFVSNVPCDGSWTSSASWTVDALDWARTIGARVTNNSNGYGFTSSAIEDAYRSTRIFHDIVHFAAAGNNGNTNIAYPANLLDVNAVAALQRNGLRAGFSNFGDGLAFSAPGEDIYSTDRTGSAGYVGDDYVWVNGTSFASPYSAGVAAIILSVNSSSTALEVEERMQETCMDLGAPGYDTDFGWGFVNALEPIFIPQAVQSNLNFYFTEPSYSGCAVFDDALFACSDLVSSPLPGPTFVWLVAAQIDGFPSGIEAETFGIDYDPGVSVIDWTLCTGAAESPQNDGNGVWPEPGTGNSVLWSGGCYDPPNEVAKIGFLFVEDGATGSMSFIPDPRTQRLESIDCLGAVYSLSAGDLGSLDYAAGTAPACGTEVAVPTGGGSASTGPHLQLGANPIRTGSALHYTVAREGRVELSVYDARGRRMDTLVDRIQTPGDYQVTWDGTRDDGTPLGSSVVFVRLVQSGTTETRKLVIVR